MEAKIIRDEELSSKDSDYPLVLLVEMNDRKNDKGMTFNFRYKLKIDKDKVSGLIESLGMSSSDVLDDEDALDYSRSAERESILSVGKYLKEQFSNSKITIDSIRTTYDTLWYLAP